MNYQQILTQYRQRIHRGDRIKLTAQERAFLVQTFIGQLQTLDSPQAIKQLCQDEIAFLELGYGKGTNSTINYLSKYRTAISEATEQGKLPMTANTAYQFNGQNQRTGEPIQATHHIAFSFMRYDSEVYLANRKATNVGNNERQDNPQPFNPDHYIEKTAELAQFDEAETLAVAIIAGAGRRHTEVAASGKFTQTKHPYVLIFDGQLKKEDPIAYTIATLLPAKQMIQAIDRFNAMPQVQAMKGLSSEDQLVKNFRARVNTRVKQHFQKTGILPILPGFQSVTVHRLRGAYARMIIHYWLPNQGANEQRFLQFYLGHVQANEMRDAFNSNSTTHYFGYRLEKEGKPITASGIKLMSNAPLPSPTDQQIAQQQQANERLDTTDSTDLDDSTDFDPEAATILPQATPTSTTTATVAEAAHTLADLPEKTQEAVPAEQNRKSQQRSTGARVSKPRFRDLAVNLSDLTAAAQRLELELPKNKGYQFLLQQVLQTILSSDTSRLTSESESERLTQAVASLLAQAIAPLARKIDQLEQGLQQSQVGGEPLKLLVNEVETLREQLETVQTERDKLQAQIEPLAALQAECDQLRAELRVKNDHLNQFLLLAQGTTPIAATEATVTATTLQASSVDAEASATFPVEAAVDIPTASPIPQERKPFNGGRKLSPGERIALAIEALIHHNQQCTNPKDRWFISNQTLADMTGTNNFTKVKPWLEQHPDIAEKVQQHNEAMETTQPHHNRGKEKEELRAIYRTFAGDHNL